MTIRLVVQPSRLLWAIALSWALFSSEAFGNHTRMRTQHVQAARAAQGNQQQFDQVIANIVSDCCGIYINDPSFNQAQRTLQERLFKTMVLNFIADATVTVNPPLAPAAFAAKLEKALQMAFITVKRNNDATYTLTDAEKALIRLLVDPLNGCV